MEDWTTLVYVHTVFISTLKEDNTCINSNLKSNDFHAKKLNDMQYEFAI